MNTVPQKEKAVQKFNKYYIIKKLADIIICMGHSSTKEISVYRAAFRTFPQREECIEWIVKTTVSTTEIAVNRTVFTYFPYMEKILYRLVDLYRPLFPPRR